ncbi:MAG: cation transporter, partial [Actinomycetes bacterium]
MTATPAAPPEQSIELAIGGMTCASCANRIEKKLNKLDGVTATVNYATEKARVSHDGSIAAADLVAVVEAAGYTAELPQPKRPVGSSGELAGADAGTGLEDEQADPTAELRRRVRISALLTVPIIAMAMIPALQFTYWQWLSFALAGPVLFWAGAPFHRAAWANLRHGAATMDTLISMGTLAAFGWSTYALFLGTAGEPGMTHPFELTVDRTDGTANIYLEVAAGVITFILVGRYVEARSKRRAGAALRALLELGAKDVAVLRDGREERV